MRRGLKFVVAGIGLAVVLTAAAAFGIVRGESSDPGSAAEVSDASETGLESAGRAAPVVSGPVLDRLRARVAAVPDDDLAWATLAIAYVDEARVTGDVALYAEADRALARSTELNGDDNFTAFAGLAAVAAARHDFETAERHALDGLEINPSSAALYGVLSDAQIQMGRYDEGFASVQRMADLTPSTASLARIAYTHELTGNVDAAVATWTRTRDEAPSGEDEALALFHLGELELAGGDPNTALGLFLDALAADPENVSALSGKAHTLGVLGQTLTAIDAYQELVESAPLADYLIEFGDFLAANGRSDEAEDLYEQAHETIDRNLAAGAKMDPGFIAFETDHGDPVEALRLAEEGIATAPSIEMHEAYAWALHVNGRHDEAVAEIVKAQRLGTRNAELHLVAAVIREAAGDRPGAITEVRAAQAIDRYIRVDLSFDPEVASALIAQAAAPT